MTLEQKIREILIVVKNIGNTQTSNNIVDVATKQIMGNIEKEKNKKENETIFSIEEIG